MAISTRLYMYIYMYVCTIHIFAMQCSYHKIKYFEIRLKQPLTNSFDNNNILTIPNCFFRRLGLSTVNMSKLNIDLFFQIT